MSDWEDDSPSPVATGWTPKPINSPATGTVASGWAPKPTNSPATDGWTPKPTNSQATDGWTPKPTNSPATDGWTPKPTNGPATDWAPITTNLNTWEQPRGIGGRGFAPGRGRGKWGHGDNRQDQQVGRNNRKVEDAWDKNGDDAWDVGQSNINSNGHSNNYGKSTSKGGRAEDSKCFRCQEFGHFSRDCPNNANVGSGRFGKGGGGDRFGSGGGGGERRSRSGDNWDSGVDTWGGGAAGNNRGKGASNGCFRCGEEGHFSRECPNNDGGRGGGGVRSGGDGCFKCGETGHFARDCPSPANDAPTRGPEQKEIYIPREEDPEEALFSHGVSSGINFSKYEHIPVSLSGDDVVDKINHFEEANLRPLLMSNILKSKYSQPTPVQKYAIPIIKNGRDLMACAQTGSGKTAAFLLPIIHNLLATGVGGGQRGALPQCPEVIIMSPTRELAIQIKDEARKFAAQSDLRAVVAYGGTSVQHQAKQLQDGCNILIATPGRLLDFVDRGKVSFMNVQYLVLDEADRMLDMGFKEDIDRMVRNPDMPGKGERQTLMFSATFPPEIQKMAYEFMSNYLFLVVGVVGGACSDVTQTFFQVSQYEKREKLLDIIRDISDAGGAIKTLVFVETKKTADFIASYMCQSGFATTSIHGDRLQREREEALQDFKMDRKPILVATAVAARGLDIKGVSQVINYDLPKQIEEYVHRIGRTGRLGNTGRATAFYDTATDAGLAADLVRILGDAQQEVPDWLAEEAVRNPEGLGGTGGGNPRFGARDIRTGPGFADSNVGVEEDECWD